MPKPSPLLSIFRDVNKKYDGLSDKVIQKIISDIESGVNPRKAVNNAFVKFNVDAKIKDLVLEPLVAASAIGYGSTVPNPLKLKSELLSKTWRGSDLKLSGRINKLGLRSKIVETINAQMSKNLSLFDFASTFQENNLNYGTLPGHLKQLLNKTNDPDLKKFIRKSRTQTALLSKRGTTEPLKALYNDLIDKIETSGTKAIRTAVKYAVKEKARYNAMRIARTEVSRAYGLGHDLKASQDSDVVGVKFSLSSGHKIYDICDYHTSVDAYGMGAGVYPKDKHAPYPFHPQCLCIMSSVYRTEAKKGTFDPKKGETWLKGKTKKQQKDLFGVQGAKDFRKNPDKWQSELNNYQGQSKVDLSGLG